MVNNERLRVGRVYNRWCGAASLIHHYDILGVFCLHCGSLGLIMDGMTFFNQVHLDQMRRQP